MRRVNQSQVRDELEKEFSMEETWKRLRGMGPLKAPSPCGFPTTFFQGTWNVNGNALFYFVRKALEKAQIPPEAVES